MLIALKRFVFGTSAAKRKYLRVPETVHLLFFIKFPVVNAKGVDADNIMHFPFKGC